MAGTIVMFVAVTLVLFYFFFSWMTGEYDDIHSIIAAVKSMWHKVAGFFGRLRSHRPAGTPTLTFKQFLSFYDMNPDRWSLRKNYVQVLEIPAPEKDRIWMHDGELHVNGTKYVPSLGWVSGTRNCAFRDVYFETAADVRKYRQWCRHAKERDAMLKEVEHTEEMLKWVRQDLQRKNNDVAAEVAKAREEALKNMVVGV